MAFVQGGGSTVPTTSRNLSRKTRTNFRRVVQQRPSTTSASRPPSTSSTSSSTSRYGTSSVSRYTPSAATQSSRTSAADRAAARQQARDEHQQYVQNVRGRNAELRLRRSRSRLNPVENSLLGSPSGFFDELPKFIGERWNRGTDQTISDATWTTIQYGNNDITAERVGYTQMYDDATNIITIPAGLDGVWLFTFGVRWTSNATGGRSIRINKNNGTILVDHRVAATAGQLSYNGSTHLVLAAGDQIEIQVNQGSGGNLDLLGNDEYTWVSYQFMGTGG
jgi:hypothetical protein